ncbi:MAG: AsmA-like C-terminal region-containing protein [Rhodopila sp.]
MIRRARQVARHCSLVLHYLNVALIGVLVVITIGLIAIAGRLSNGPIDVTWMAALYGNEIPLTRGGVHLSFGHAALSWEGFQSGASVPLDIRLTDVRVTDSEDRVLASAGHAFASVALGPLLLGRLVPRAVDLSDGIIALIRDREGTPDLGLSPELDAEASQPAKPAQTAPAPSFSELLRGSDVLGQLDHVSLRNFRLELRGNAEPPKWQATIGNLGLQRQANGDIAGEAHVPFVLDDRTADLDLSVRLPRDGTGAINAKLSAVEAAAVAQIFPALSFLAAVQAPASADVTMRLDHDLSLVGGYGTILLDPGRVTVGKGSLSISRGSLRAHVTLRHVVIDEASLSVWTARPNVTTTIGLTGTIDRMGERIGASVTASVDNLDVADLPVFWPAEAAQNARTWVVQNVTAGSVPHASAVLVAEGAADLKDITLTKATADLDGTNVTLTWLDQIPPIEKAQVHLHLADPDKLVISMASGRQRISNGGADLLIHDSQMEITGLSVPDQTAKLNLQVDGPVPSALILLKEPRLKLLSKQKLELQEPGGTAAVKVGLEFPLETKLQAEQIVFHVAAHVEQLRLARLVAGRNLTDGVLDLTADTNGLTIKGQAALAGIPLSADAFMDFNSGPPSQVLQRVNASGRPTIAQLAGAGLPVEDMLTSGDVGLTATLIERRSGDGTITLNADLGNATMRLKPVGLNKVAGAPAKAAATLVMSHDVLKSIQNISLAGQDIDVAGSAELADGSIRSVTIARARAGRTDLRGSVQMPARAPMQVNLSGPAIDLSTLLDAPSEPGKRRNTIVPDLDLKARFDRAFLAKGETASAISAQATTRGSHLWSLDFGATLASRSAVSARVAPSGGIRRLTVDAADAGSLLRGLGLTSSVRDGKLTIRGDYDDRVASHPLTGRAEIDDARLENVPLLGKLLQAATLYGIADLVNGPGMGVSHIIFPFGYANEQLSVNEARMFSGSLGLTAQGLVDVGADRISLNGTVVPAYALNSALGRIPFVGKIFSPETGGGLFAARYSIDGPLADPSVSVNPLSVLTPGFLRGLFDVGDRLR